MSSFISYYNSHRPEIDDGYYSDGSDPQESNEPVLRESPVQDREESKTKQSKYRRRKTNVQHKQEAPRETVMEVVDDRPDEEAFSAEQNYHGLRLRIQKTTNKYNKWKQRCKKYKKKIKDEKLKRKSRKRAAADVFTDDYQDTIPMDGFLRPYKH